MLQNNVKTNDLYLRQIQYNFNDRIATIVRLSNQIQTHKRQLSQLLGINSILLSQVSLCQSPAAQRHQISQHQQATYNIKLENLSEQSEELKNQRKDEIFKYIDEQKKAPTHDKNQTKNIPKNYGKAILSFIQRNIQRHINIIKPILQSQNLTVHDLLIHIKKHKKEVNSINYLKEMWGYHDKQNKIFKCIRILSYIFMRKHCLSYIFNSRVKNYSTHIKYRTRIIEGIQHPQEFTCIKQF